MMTLKQRLVWEYLKMKILKRRIRLELESGQWTHWLDKNEFRKYTVQDKAQSIKTVVIEETMSYADAMEYMNIIKG